MLWLPVRRCGAVPWPLLVRFALPFGKADSGGSATAHMARHTPGSDLHPAPTITEQCRVCVCVLLS